MRTTAHDLVLVSDDALLTRSVRLAADARCNVLIARSIPEALKLLASGPVRAAILDGALFNAKNVTRDIAKLRGLAPMASLLFVTSQLGNTLLNELQVQRVQLVVRPLPSDAIALFLERAFSAGRVERGSLRAWVTHLSGACDLSPFDLALLPLVLGDEQAEETCARLGLDGAQLTRGLRRLVRKCRVRNIDRLARNLMRDAYLLGSAVTQELIEHDRAVSF